MSPCISYNLFYPLYMYVYFKFGIYNAVFVQLGNLCPYLTCVIKGALHSNYYNMQECATRVEVQDHKSWLHTT